MNGLDGETEATTSESAMEIPEAFVGHMMMLHMMILLRIEHMGQKMQDRAWSFFIRRLEFLLQTKQWSEQLLNDLADEVADKYERKKCSNESSGSDTDGTDDEADDSD